ncbi:hypothetical protein EVAR_90536_1 [Eumeta japonica]|uniref:Uncharacterized protein n=1 Tax=Eumeta variegata TaxID=151549 RepID=A0A4C1XUN9_EUMVA|nr:hypothetical protein EVAR_90536_1 [Eumeta japonica]
MKKYERGLRTDELSVKYLLYYDDQVILVPSTCELQYLTALRVVRHAASCSSKTNILFFEQLFMVMMIERSISAVERSERNGLRHLRMPSRAHAPRRDAPYGDRLRLRRHELQSFLFTTTESNEEEKKHQPALRKAELELGELPQAVFLEFDDYSVTGNRPRTGVRIELCTTEFDALRGKEKIERCMLLLILNWAATVP